MLLETEAEHFTADPDELEEKKLLEKFLKETADDADDLADVRDHASAALRFINVIGGMWENFLEKEFGQRTKLEFDQTSDFVNRFLGEWASNRVGVEFKPVGGKTSDEDADVVNGIFRADFRDRNGKLSVDNAMKEAAVCGYGAVKCATEFEDPEDPENDNQRNTYFPIMNAFDLVFWDRASRWPNKKDARRCTLLEPFTKEAFDEQFPGEDPLSAYTPLNRTRNSHQESKKDIIYVAIRYHIAKVKTKVHVYMNLKDGSIETIPDEDHKAIAAGLAKDKFRKKIRVREVVRKYCMRSRFTGAKFLEKPRRIPGKFIPIIPFYAYLSFSNNIEHYHGLVQKLMDPQRLMNMQMSKLAEISGSTGSGMPVLFPDQVEGLESLWADPINKPYMLINPIRNEQGEIILSGPVTNIEPPSLGGIDAALIQMVPNHIQQVTGGAPQDTVDPDASGKAINALRKREDMKTFTIFDNAATSMEHLGEVVLSQMQDILTSKRVMKMLSRDGTESNVTLFKEIQDERTGRIVQINKLNEMKFKAYPDASAQYESLREQTVEDLKGMMQLMIDAGPAGAKYVPLMATMMLENMSGVGLGSLKKIVRQDMIIQGIQEPETDEEKAIVKQLEEQAGQPGEQEKLAEALTQQALGEAEKFRSEGRNLDSKSISNIADARKKAAETLKIQSETRKLLSDAANERATTLASLVESNLNRAQDLPFGPS